MSRPRVYLAGKMDGLTREQMTGWRNEVSRSLKFCGFDVLDPTNTPLSGEQSLGREISDSNKFMIRQSDVILAELDHDQVSIGTVCEIVFAYLIGKPVIVWGKAERIINHPWMVDHTTKRFMDWQNAVDYLIANYGL